MTPPSRRRRHARRHWLARRAARLDASPVMTWAVWLAPRVLAAYAVYLFAAYPVYSALTSPAVAFNAKLAWLALAVLAFVRPAWSPFVLVALVPLVPWLTTYMRRMPQGLVHLIVLSQALPLLVRYRVRARVRRHSTDRDRSRIRSPRRTGSRGPGRCSSPWRSPRSARTTAAIRPCSIRGRRSGWKCASISRATCSKGRTSRSPT